MNDLIKTESDSLAGSVAPQANENEVNVGSVSKSSAGELDEACSIPTDSDSVALTQSSAIVRQLMAELALMRTELASLSLKHDKFGEVVSERVAELGLQIKKEITANMDGIVRESSKRFLKKHRSSLERKIETLDGFPFVIKEQQHTTSSQTHSVSGAKLKVASYRG